MNDKFQIFGCAIIQDRPEQVLPNVKQLLPFVDKMILIDGGSKKDMLDELRTLGDKVMIVDYKWRDNFPLSRQQYLDTVGKVKKPNKDAWVLRFDSDEFISLSFLQRLDRLIQYAYQENYNGLGIRCRGITVDRNNIETHTNLDDYWKMLCYKWYPDLCYTAGGAGLVHEGYNKGYRIFNVPAKEERGRDEELVYLHVKTQGDTWGRASSRNLVVGGGGPNLGEKQKLWKPLLLLIKKYVENYNTYHDYAAYLEKGNIAQELKDFFIKYAFEGEIDKSKIWKDYCILNGIVNEGYDFISDSEKSMGFGYNGASEVKEMYKYYFRWLHQEEEPEQLKSIHIP